MALFFDQDWFRARLAEAGKTHDALAAAAGLTLEELAAVWKDQRVVTAEMVAGFASVLRADAREVAARCGVSTPDASTHGADEPVAGDRGSASDSASEFGSDSGNDERRAMLADGLARLDRLESDVAALRNLMTQLIEKEPTANK